MVLTPPYYTRDSVVIGHKIMRRGRYTPKDELWLMCSNGCTLVLGHNGAEHVTIEVAGEVIGLISTCFASFEHGYYKDDCEDENYTLDANVTIRGENGSELTCVAKMHDNFGEISEKGLAWEVVREKR
jgi:hypothetical protein